MFFLNKIIILIFILCFIAGGYLLTGDIDGDQRVVEVSEEVETDSITSSLKPSVEPDVQEVEVVDQGVMAPQSYIEDKSTQLNEGERVAAESARILESIEAKNKLFPSTKERDELFEAPVVAANNKDWDAFLKSGEKLKQEAPAAFHLMLTQAIKNNAPTHVFETLLARGAEFDIMHLVYAIQTSDVSLFNRLIPLGLDIHMETNDKQNAIYTFIRSQPYRNHQGRGLFDYLLANGVTIHPNSNGKDPLELALTRVQNDEAYLYYVTKLVEHGAPVHSKHLALMQKVKESAPAHYEVLTMYAPALKQG